MKWVHWTFRYFDPLGYEHLHYATTYITVMTLSLHILQGSVCAQIYLQLSIPQILKNLLRTSTEILHVNESKHKPQIQKWNYADVYYMQHWILLHSTGTTKSSEMKLYLLAVFINITYSNLCTQIMKYKICI